MIRFQKGFSLIEVAIVLGVIGTLIGGIWMFSKQSWTNSERTEAALQINIVATNVRNFYAGQLGVPAKSQAALTSALFVVGAIPASMARTGGCGTSCIADNPWGPGNGSGTDSLGTFQVCNEVLPAIPCASATAPTHTSQFFGIALTGLTQQTCGMLLDQVTGPAGPPGLVEVNIMGASEPSGFNLANKGHQIQPVTDTDANGYCPPPTNGGTTVTFVYRLTVPG